MFKQNLLSAAVLAACLGVAAPAAHANTITIPLIDFAPSIACTNTVANCNDLSLINTDYGSVLDVLSLSWGSTDGQDQTSVTNTAKWWSTLYGSLSGVAWAEGGVAKSLQVKISALSGYSLASLSFDYAGF